CARGNYYGSSAFTYW
nr:immunoglobulin heavy chain junction region [Mus musculus]